jgi:hypothetical protein
MTLAAAAEGAAMLCAAIARPVFTRRRRPSPPADVMPSVPAALGTEPKFSVIIPTFNRATLVLHASTACSRKPTATSS